MTVLRPPAGALDAAVRLLQDRTGRIDVVYVTHLSRLAALSADAIAEVEKEFDEIGQDLRAQAAVQVCASGAAWEFERRQGIIADQLIAGATAIGEAHPDENVAIIVGSPTPCTAWWVQSRSAWSATRRCRSISCRRRSRAHRRRIRSGLSQTEPRHGSA